MKIYLFSLAPVLLLSACASQPSSNNHSTELSVMKKHMDEAKAGHFGDLLVHMHKAEDHLDNAETLYKKMQTKGVNNDLRKQGEQAAKRAMAHRISAEQAFDKIMRPLEVGIESNTRNMENLDYRLAYIEDLHVPEGLAIPEENVYFDFGSARVLSGQKDKLQEVVNFLKEYPLFAMELIGYADTVGSKTFNHRLAEKRNQAVLQGLRKRGLPKQVIVTIAVGEADGPDEMQNPDNRRVEIRPYVHGRYVERIAINTDNEVTAEAYELDLDGSE